VVIVTKSVTILTNIEISGPKLDSSINEDKNGKREYFRLWAYRKYRNTCKSLHVLPF